MRWLLACVIRVNDCQLDVKKAPFQLNMERGFSLYERIYVVNRSFVLTVPLDDHRVNERHALIVSFAI